jgi:putative selenate reductase
VEGNRDDETATDDNGLLTVMDCARAAKRNTGITEVRIVYRRTRDFMPSQHEAGDGPGGRFFLTNFWPPSLLRTVFLLANGCSLRTTISPGRRGITGTGLTVEMNFNTVIGAVGARVDTDHITRNGIALNAWCI